MKNKLYTAVAVLGLLIVACAWLPESDEETPLQWYERSLQYADDAFSGSYKAFMAVQPHVFTDPDWDLILHEVSTSEGVVDHLEALVARLETPPSGIVVQEETLEIFRDGYVRLSTWTDAEAGMEGWGEGVMAIQTGRCSLIKHAPPELGLELPEVCS